MGVILSKFMYHSSISRLGCDFNIVPGAIMKTTRQNAFGFADQGTKVEEL